MKEVVNNENRMYCSKCGGVCCKTMGGFLHPDDINTFDEETIQKMLDSGKYSIDWVECDGKIPIDENVYFIRFRHVNAPIVDPSFGGTCVMLGENGCTLPFDERAYACKVLTPCDDTICTNVYTKDLVAQDWNKPEYQTILKKFVDELYNPESESEIEQIFRILGML